MIGLLANLWPSATRHIGIQCLPNLSLATMAWSVEEPHVAPRLPLRPRRAEARAEVVVQALLVALVRAAAAVQARPVVLEVPVKVALAAAVVAAALEAAAVVVALVGAAVVAALVEAAVVVVVRY